MNKEVTRIDRKKIPRQPMLEQDPRIRSKNFLEVPLGYTPQMAQMEAQRCIQCKNPKCVPGCPVQVKIPEFIKLIAEGDFAGAARKLKEDNALPAICGRVCPQEDQCEKLCVTGLKGEPVAVGRLERFAADYERMNNLIEKPVIPSPTGRKVAVIGAGPAGLTVAGDLAKLGHEVVIFEALHKPGGVLFYGIPEFRLPKEIVESEVNYLRSLGVDIRTNYVIGRIKSIDELMDEDGFEAIFIGTGAGLPYFMGIPGENLNAVYSANEFLTRLNLMRAWDFPNYDTPLHEHKKMAVIGGGNTAMDAARISLRLPTTEKVYIIYRRSRKEMPARNEEIEHGEAEGVEFHMLTAPIQIIGKDGWVSAIECIKMELGEPDSSGRRRPIPIKGSNYVMEVDAVILAIGNGSNPLLMKATPGLKTNKHGNIEVVDVEIGLTAREGVFAGGDIVTGAATVIEAMGAGKKAAMGIHRYIMSKEPKIR
jgi:glutamate synthase (NADPH/NADH) small chain